MPSCLTKEIADKVDDAYERTKEILHDAVPKGGSAIIVGVGNTSGVP